jgi:hypothetical protein
MKNNQGLASKEWAVNKINKIVWIGLIINALTLGILAYAMGDAFYYLWIMIVIYLIALALQLASVFILFKIPRIGFILAIATSVIMLPLSMVFFIGYLFSYENCRHGGLTLFKDDERCRSESELHFKTSTLAMRGLLFMISGLVLGSLGLFIAWLLVCAGLLTFVNSFRLKKHIMLGLVDNNLVVTPGLYAQTYLVPLSDVILIEENKKLFQLKITTANVNRICTFRKNLIKDKNHQTALEDIFSKLALQNKESMTAL